MEGNILNYKDIDINEIEFSDPTKLKRRKLYGYSSL